MTCRAFVFAAIVLLAAAGARAGDSTPPTPPPDPMMRGMIDWIVERTDYRPAPPPLIVFIPQPDMQARSGKRGFAVTAGYANGLLFLRVTWQPDAFSDRVTLLHELVHHLQLANNARFACKGEAEVEAYRLQDEWVRAHGGDPLDHRPDNASLRILTACPQIEGRHMREDRFLRHRTWPTTFTVACLTICGSRQLRRHDCPRQPAGDDTNAVHCGPTEHICWNDSRSC